MTTEVHGRVGPGFEALVDVFATSAAGDPGGAAVSIRVAGETVVDLWTGSIGPAGSPAWQEDTPTAVFSCTKGVLTVLVAMLVQEGALALDEPVATSWPEFAARGKGSITVREALAHRAGLSATRRTVDLDTALDWDAMTRILADQEPLWPPGQGHSYHALTFGWLAGELVRRATGLSVGQALRDRITGPLHADMWIGVPPSVEPRVTRLIPATVDPASPSPQPEPVPEHAYWMERAMTLGDAFPATLARPGEGFDSARVHAAEVPGAGGIGSAAGLATIWSATVVETDGVRLLDTAVTEDMTRVQSEGPPVWLLPGPYPRWGTGFMLGSEVREFLTPRSFGHDGLGGQVAFADPVHEVGFAYVTNYLDGSRTDLRGTALVRALRAILEG